MLWNLIFFIINFVVAYLIYDESSIVKPLLATITLTILLNVADLIKSRIKKR